MADLQEKVVKMKAKAEAKGSKAATKRTRTEELKAVAAAEGGSPSSDEPDHDSSSLVVKKQETQPRTGVPPIISEFPTEDDIVLSSCTLNRGIFTQKNLLLHKEEAKNIIVHDKATRSAELAEHIEGMM